MRGWPGKVLRVIFKGVDEYLTLNLLETGELFGGEKTAWLGPALFRGNNLIL